MKAGWYAQLDSWRWMQTDTTLAIDSHVPNKAPFNSIHLVEIHPHIRPHLFVPNFKESYTRLELSDDPDE